MADILIRGMEIPKDGRKHTVLLQFLEDGKCRGIVEYSKSYDDRSVKVFEVSPLPEGHGRLIDGDAPIRVAYYDGTIHKTTASRLLCEHSLLDLPKTIVPAEGGADNG